MKCFSLLVFLPVIAFSQLDIIRHPDIQRLSRIQYKLMRNEQLTQEEVTFSIKMLSSEVVVWRMKASLVLSLLVSQKRMSMAMFTRHHVLAGAAAEGKQAGATMLTFTSMLDDNTLTKEVGVNVRRKEGFHRASIRYKSWPEFLKGSRPQRVRALFEILTAKEWTSSAQQVILRALTSNTTRVKGAEKELVLFTKSVLLRKSVKAK